MDFENYIECVQNEIKKRKLNVVNFVPIQSLKFFGKNGENQNLLFFEFGGEIYFIDYYGLGDFYNDFFNVKEYQMN